ncbi:MAG: class I SAM-dependent methyltransferase [Chloroflexota bacterium]
MGETARPLDPDALRYHEHWQPVLDGGAQRLLDRVAGDASELLDAPTHRPRLLDIGAGSGALVLAAASRWPRARMVGLDASASMLSVAQHRAVAAGLSDDHERMAWLVADAATMPLDDASVDVAVSSFVLQLVDDRKAVLSEIRRVLRPDGVFGFVTWIAEELQVQADSEFDEAVYALKLDDSESSFSEPRSGDYESLAEARAELVDAGFSEVALRADRLTFSWTRDAYLAFKVSFDERELFESLSAPDRTRLKERVRERWAALPDEAFRLEAPLVSAVARRPLGRAPGGR